MKILHLSTYRFGGAANAAFQLHRGLLDEKIDSNFAVRSLATAKSSVVAAPSGLRHLYAEQAPRIEYHFAKLFRPNVRPVLTAYTFPGVCRDLIKKQAPDVVNLHWVEHNFVSIRDLKWLSDSRIPIVWTLHDMNPITGGIGFRETAGLPVDALGPITFLDSRRDLSDDILKRRQSALKNAKIVIIAPSKWLADEAELSPVFQNRRVEHIPYGIDTQIFHPVDPSKSRKHWDLPLDRPILLFGADAFSDPRKGLHHLKAAFQNIKFDANTRSPLLVGFGNKEPLDSTLMGMETVGLGRIEDQKELAMLYSTADVFLCPSREDNLPNTMLESMACGTPVVGFSVGGLVDMVIEEETGYLAPCFDEAALGRAIGSILNLGQERTSQIRENCRRKIVESYTTRIQALAYISIYESLI